MERFVSLALIEQADEELRAGRYREAGRLALEAADAVETEIEADAVASFAEDAMFRCGFANRGRFESAVEQAEERRTLLQVPA